MESRILSRREFIKVVVMAGGAATFSGLMQACAAPAAPIAAPTTAAATAVPPTAAATAASTEAVTLKFWHQWGGSRTELLQKLLDQFQAEHPNIKVQAELHTFDNWPTEQLTAVAGGDVPDLALGAPLYVPEYAKSGALVPLTPFIQKDGIDLKNTLYPSEYSLTQANGDTWILPMPTNGGANIMFYNKKMLKDAGLNPDKPPQTWDELKDAAKKLTKIENGRVVTNGFTIVGSNPTVQDFKHWLVTNDAEWISQDGKTVKFNSPNGVETLQWIVDFADDVYGGWDKVAVASGAQEEAIWNNLYNSKEAMYVSGPWMFNLIKSNAPDVYENLGVAMRPRNKGKSVGAVVGDGVGVWMLKGGKHPEESWELLKYLTIGAGGCDFMKAQARPSPVVACNSAPSFKEGNPAWDTVLQVLQSETALPITPVNAKIDAIGQQMLEQALFHKMTPQEAIDWGAEQVQKILDSQ